MAKYLNGHVCPLCGGYVIETGENNYTCEDCGYEMERAETVNASFMDAE